MTIHTLEHKECKGCGNIFRAYKGRAKFFCSLECFYTWRRKNVDPEKKKAYQRKWRREDRKNNIERYKAKDKAHYAKNRQQIIDKNREYYQKNFNARRDKSRARGLQLKLEVLGHYSNDKVECAICEENQWECLSIDHTKGGGNRHRKELGNFLGQRFYWWLRKNNFPAGYRVLCMNCQFIERERIKQ